MDSIGFIGLGNMGRPMASNLVRKGFSLVAFDVNPAPLTQLRPPRRAGRRRAASLAGDSDVVITMLPNSASVEEVLLGPGGVLARLRAGGAVMDMSTVDPVLTDQVAAAAADRGSPSWTRPSDGLPALAERGESLFMVGAMAGPARVWPLLGRRARTIHHCGGPGTAAAKR